MAYYSAFQRSAFQRTAFQIKIDGAVPPSVELLGGGPGYEKEEVYNPHAFQYRQQELQQRKIAEHRAALQIIDDELAEAERLKQEKLAKQRERLQAKKAAKQLAALEAQLQEEINRLRMERVWLMRQIDDEECILIMMIKRRRIF